jgi:hypothetical protein
MRTSVWLTFCVAVTALSVARAVDMSDDPSGLWTSLRGTSYKFHSGVVADGTPPIASDSRLTFLVEGKTAKELFDSIGPGHPDICGDEKRDQERRRKGIACFYTAKDEKDKDGPYRCWIGLDLRTGNTINTITC